MFPTFEEMKPTEEMLEAAKTQLHDEILCVYRDGNAIRAEMIDADDPYVWRDGKWHPMKDGRL